VEKIERNHQCEITLKDGEIIPSQLLVGSDGNKSKVKELSRVATYGWSYRQRAIVCTMKVEESNLKIGQQIYHEGNTLAFLPLWDNYVSLVWSLKLPEF
jgi:2-octaprenyl-6-methoxyphenol hydroxylase